ncbi:MAG: YihA family ribosome biogenesis GTP-binding protein [Gammaproteobacteria bacterium]|nr:YihA family ribosome biogenesis GTP-binding protein [Gammaproteobacteria bacterium]|tara:strand:- start:1494 stop:2075 length:582 start_codon:yes stop_codon:yes gene_type:complete
MYFSKTKFMKSASNISECPDDIGAEIAFVGRSNSGKSSAINVIVNQKNLARISKTPGRTQLINFFEIERNERLVDLPGYGYAKTSKSQQKEWGLMIGEYLKHRETLKGIILIIDIRRGLMELDDAFLDFYLPLNKPLHILLTKSDKLKKQACRKSLDSVESIVGEVSSIQLFSSLKKLGTEEARETILELLGS